MFCAPITFLLNLYEHKRGGVLPRPPIQVTRRAEHPLFYGILRNPDRTRTRTRTRTKPGLEKNPDSDLPSKKAGLVSTKPGLD